MSDNTKYRVRNWPLAILSRTFVLQTTLMANLETGYADGDNLWSLQQHGYVAKALVKNVMVVLKVNLHGYGEDAVVVEEQMSFGKPLRDWCRQPVAHGAC